MSKVNEIMREVARYCLRAIDAQKYPAQEGYKEREDQQWEVVRRLVEALAQQGQAKTPTEFEDQAIDAEIDAMLASNEAADSLGRERETREQLAAAIRKIRRLERAQHGQGKAVGAIRVIQETESTTSKDWEFVGPCKFYELPLGLHRLYTAPQPLPDRDKSGWCSYIAGMIGTYMALESGPNVQLSPTQEQAIAGIIERRMWALPLPDREPLTEAEKLLPHGYLFAKVGMVMPLFQEARDALTALTEAQRVVHGISKSLADRMDVAGTYSLDDWEAAHGIKKGGA